MTRMARWRRDLLEPLPEGEERQPVQTLEDLKRRIQGNPAITPHPTCQICGRQVPAKDWDVHQATHGITPDALHALHDAVIDATIGKTGPRTFLRHLGEIVAAHLHTQDEAQVKAAIVRLRDRNLVYPMDPEPDEWSPRGMWWINAF